MTPDRPTAGTLVFKLALEIVVVHVFVILLVLSAGNGACRADESDGLVIHPDRQLRYASDLMSSGDNETAILEFKRFIYFFPDNPERGQAEAGIAECLYRIGRFEDAVTAFRGLCLAAPEDQPDVEACFGLSRSYAALGSFEAAGSVLLDLSSKTDDPELLDRIYSSLAWIGVDQSLEFRPGSLDRSLGFLGRITTSGKERYHADELAAGIRELAAMPLKNPRVAGSLALLPGAGFAYCGRYRDGFISFLVNAGLTAAAIQAFDNDSEALGAILAVVESGFYMAGIYGSVSSAHKVNRLRRNSAVEDLRQKHAASFSDLVGMKPGTHRIAVACSIPF